MESVGRKTIDYVTCQLGELNTSKAFYRARLTEPEVGQLVADLDRCAESDGPRWFTLTVTDEKPERLRLTEMPGAPQYELEAAAVYLRGDVFRVSGKAKSCNIDFSGRVGAVLLSERLRRAQARMRRFLEIRVPSRKRNLIEFIPDTDLEAADSPEHDKLAQAGEALGADLGSSDEFSDWEC